MNLTKLSIVVPIYNETTTAKLILKKVAGDKWNEALMPKGMEKHIEKCSISHYEKTGMPL